MSPRFVLGRKNVPCVAEVVNRSLKADCTDFIRDCKSFKMMRLQENCRFSSANKGTEEWLALL